MKSDKHRVGLCDLFINEAIRVEHKLLYEGIKNGVYLNVSDYINEFVFAKVDLVVRVRVNFEVLVFILKRHG